MKKIILGIYVTAIILLVSCNPQRHIAGNYSYESECMGVEQDGSQTIKTWGSGRNRSDAIEQAKKNAVRDVLFKGIRKGKTECNLKPVIVAVNAQENNESYFNKFFADNGPYKEFITGEDGSNLHFSVFKGRKQAGDQETYGIIVRVQRAKLREKMIIDNIIK